MRTMSRRSRRHRNPSQDNQDKKFFSNVHESPLSAGKGAFFQAKLAIGQPGDKYEQEADAVANAVVNQQSGASPVQQKEDAALQRYMTNPEVDERGTNTERIEEDKRIQEKPIQMMGQEEEEVQMQPEEEEEPIQKMGEEEEELQMQPEEEEEPLQARHENQSAGSSKKKALG